MKALEITPAIVRQAEETEEQIVSVCRELVEKIDDCKWQVGRLAHEWTKRFARGRTDADFGQLVGLSEDQVQRRRKVFSTYGDVSASMRKLSERWLPSPFPLSCRVAGELLEVSHTTAAGWLFLLVAEGVLDVHEVGTKGTRRASEYFYRGDRSE
jgi:hypothetical protein